MHGVIVSLVGVCVCKFVFFLLCVCSWCRCAVGEDCVSLWKVCDGVEDCTDSGDEAFCDGNE